MRPEHDTHEVDTVTERGGLRPVGPVADAYDAFARRDLRGLGLFVTDDVRVTWCSGAETVVVEGRDGLLETLANLVNATDGTAAGDLVSVTPAGADRVVALHRERAAWRGRVHDAEAEVVFTLRAGVIAGADRRSVISRRPPPRHVP